MHYPAKFLINNPKGQVNFLGILVLMLALSLFGLFVLKKLHQHLQLKQEIKEYLCIKEYNGRLQNYVQFMQKTNWALSNVDKIDKILWLFPTLKIVKGASKGLEIALKRMQELKTISILQKLTKLKRNSCPIPLNGLIPPYNLVNRGASGEARLRSEKWELIFFGKKIIRQSLRVTSNALKIKTYQIR